MSGSLTDSGTMSYQDAMGDFEAANDVARVNVLLADGFETGVAFIHPSGGIMCRSSATAPASRAWASARAT